MLDVSYQTVYNHMNKNENDMVGTIYKKLGTTHINQDGIDILKKSMGLIQVPTVKENIDMEEIIVMISDRVALEFKEEMKEYKEQQEIHNEELKKEMKLLQEQNQKLLDKMQEESNKSFFERLFKKK